MQCTTINSHCLIGVRLEMETRRKRNPSQSESGPKSKRPKRRNEISLTENKDNLGEGTQTKIEFLYVSIKKIGLHVPIILFRKNQITYNFYTFVSEIKHETSKATEAEIKVISTTTGISKLSKTL